MPDTTPIYSWPVPVLGDPDNPPGDITALATAIEAQLHGVLVEQLPVFDDSNSLHIAGADVRCAQSDTTNLLIASFTLTRTQVVLVAGKARFQADPTSSALGNVGVTILVDGTFDRDHGMAGPTHIDQYGNPGAVAPLAIPIYPIILAAGAHTIKLQADRDSTGVINATGTTSGIGAGGRTYNPTSLTVIV